MLLVPLFRCFGNASRAGLPSRADLEWEVAVRSEVASQRCRIFRQDFEGNAPARATPAIDSHEKQLLEMRLVDACQSPAYDLLMPNLHADLHSMCCRVMCQILS